MTIARAEQILLTETLFYHCVCRCVRQAFLCGEDQQTGRSYEYRKLWVIERIQQLTDAFCVEVAAYAIMSNHYHIVIYVNQNKAASLSDAEVAARWYKVFKANRVVDLYLAGDESLKELAQATLNEWRDRLTSISWFMKYLNEHIARRANTEDGCKGRFWEGRFKSQPLLDEKALLAAMQYIDLNPIRAGIAQNICDSEYTSAYQRLHGKPCTEAKSTTKIPLMPFTGCNNNSKGLPFDEKNYMDLLDYSGRIARPGKSGVISEKQPKLLDIIAFNNNQWELVCIDLECSNCKALGKPENVICFQKARGRKRLVVNSTITQMFG